MFLFLRPLLLIGAAVAGFIVLSNMGAAPQAPELVGGVQRCDFKVTADLLNVRTGPSTQYPVAAKLRRDALTPGTVELDNGFRKLGNERWVADQFLSPDKLNTCR
ncbi:hypothetical protein GCM10022247_09300 [Allokutzneria multivorans]|uniref:SH3 domain-containing protein n=1 Tax=Allokutzneria multivorans TaxID=1142134 RepID=A0ABP7R5K4_9PSEU